MIILPMAPTLRKGKAEILTAWGHGNPDEES
jgi:hypothetical protein